MSINDPLLPRGKRNKDRPIPAALISYKSKIDQLIKEEKELSDESVQMENNVAIGYAELRCICDKCGRICTLEEMETSRGKRNKDRPIPAALISYKSKGYEVCESCIDQLIKEEKEPSDESVQMENEEWKEKKELTAKKEMQREKAKSFPHLYSGDISRDTVINIPYGYRSIINSDEIDIGREPITNSRRKSSAMAKPAAKVSQKSSPPKKRRAHGNKK